MVRLYVEPGSWDGRGDDEPPATEGDRERWCFVCRTHYPHRLVDAAG